MYRDNKLSAELVTAATDTLQAVLGRPLSRRACVAEIERLLSAETATGWVRATLCARLVENGFHPYY
jgi:hypothetical protein